MLASQDPHLEKCLVVHSRNSSSRGAQTTTHTHLESSSQQSAVVSQRVSTAVEGVTQQQSGTGLAEVLYWLSVLSLYLALLSHQLPDDRRRPGSPSELPLPRTKEQLHKAPAPPCTALHTAAPLIPKHPALPARICNPSHPHTHLLTAAHTQTYYRPFTQPHTFTLLKMD